jgi:excinuclease ABC subunit A
MEKPDVDHIEGLSPAISIEQKSTSHNPRSTVGTITEIYDYLRLLYARVGTRAARTTASAGSADRQPDGRPGAGAGRTRREQRWMLLAPVVRERKGEHAQVFEQLRAQGFVRVRVDGVLHEIDAVPPLALRQKHTIEAVIDRFKPREDIKQRLAESFETALKLGDGMAIVQSLDEPEREPLLFSSKYACPVCDYSLPELEPRLFSFNNAGGRLPELRRPGRGRVLRSGARGRASGAVAGRRRDARLGPAQRLLLPDDHLAGQALRFDVDAPWQRCPRDPRRRAARQRRGGDQPSPTSPRTAASTSASTLRGHRPEPGAPLPRDRIGAVREELAKYISDAPLPRLRRRAPEPRRAQRVRRRPRRCREIVALPIDEAWRSSHG